MSGQVDSGASGAEPTVVSLTTEEVEARLYTLRSDREEWDRLADTYRNYWRLTDEISHYEWLLGGEAIPRNDCFCGQGDDSERVHRAQSCQPWSTPANSDSGASS